MNNNLAFNDEYTKIMTEKKSKDSYLIISLVSYARWRQQQPDREEVGEAFGMT